MVGAKMPASTAAKLEHLARQTRRTKSQVLRMLIERARPSDLEFRYSRRELDGERTG